MALGLGAGGISALAQLITALGTPLAAAFSGSSSAATTIKGELQDIENHPDDLNSVASNAAVIQQVAAMNGMPDIAGMAGQLFRTVTSPGAVPGPLLQAAIFAEANAISGALASYVGSIFSALRNSSSSSTTIGT